jgi:hypothetical protein
MAMKITIAVTAVVLSTIAFSAAAQKSEDSTSQHNIAAPDTPNPPKQPVCPDLVLVVNLKTVEEEEKKLPKEFKWDKNCIAQHVRLFNESVQDLKKKMFKKPCDPKFTQKDVDVRVRSFLDSWDATLKFCRLPKP